VAGQGKFPNRRVKSHRERKTAIGRVFVKKRKPTDPLRKAVLGDNTNRRSVPVDGTPEKNPTRYTTAESHKPGKAGQRGCSAERTAGKPQFKDRGSSPDTKPKNPKKVNREKKRKRVTTPGTQKKGGVLTQGQKTFERDHPGKASPVLKTRENGWAAGCAF